jgi:hypothetical protein
MTTVDWSAILGSRATVDFSSLEIPDRRDEFEPDVAQFRLTDGSLIDVTWVFDAARYVVTHFHDSYENPIAEIECKTPSDVVEAVRRLVNESDSPLQSASSRKTTSSRFQFHQYA